MTSFPTYECGGCGEGFGSNCALDDIACTECGAKLCPGCGVWFGGDAGEPDNQGVIVSPDDLRTVLDRAGGLPPAVLFRLREAAGMSP